jgi:hypothetical protein
MWLMTPFFPRIMDSMLARAMSNLDRYLAGRR